ncbi:PP2C family serine/threonine-protein phosphatase [Alkalihalobacterium chitinilyticum]|uniref:SpoIIE family protein phosphatase n=1 Tax=Alkalihalobacterium chitinilyticum TaxID=2980103 RepID=A0ABT5VKX0_9BACI|nr:PP2C family serine/threonine-protein phosphatase [Alkalihalobacterium chitinilyticum]MDE5416076.1 SpoIIE family protein phosphatase [Alkalihalobacterium chitinilyticum]
MIEFQKKQHVSISAYQKPKNGNVLCGDSYVVVEKENYVVCAVSDGLGSGEQAYASSDTVMEVIRQNHHEDVKKIVELCNKSLASKRGVVLTVIKFDRKDREVHYSNIGNIGFLFYSSKGQMIRPIPYRGFLSGRKINVKTESFPYDPGSIFVIFSDGIKLSGLKHENLTDMRSQEEAGRFIERHVSSVDDDLTLLVGQLH